MRFGGARRWLLLAGALVGAAAFADGPRLARVGAVAYSCGGAGADERAAMKPLEAAANLKLLFVTAKRGGYLADAELTVTDARAGQFTIAGAGPICLLHLPAGSYRLRAAIGGAARVARVAVGTDFGKPQRIVFAFPGEPWDGIRASPQEKLQAKE